LRQFKSVQHYKGGIYLILGEALHTETEEVMVIYVCAAGGEMFCRPKSMFEEMVDTPGYKGPRFIPLPDAMSKEERKKVRLF